MAQKIKIEISGVKGLVVQKVSFQEADNIIKKAYTDGCLVIDKTTGYVIYELNTNIKELWITDVIAGG